MTEPPLTEGGFRFTDRSKVLCRTCLSPLTWDERTEPGYLPRVGWYDDSRADQLVCFSAIGYRHVPLTDREWAYYSAGYAAALDATPTPHPTDSDARALRDTQAEAGETGAGHGNAE